MCCLEKTLDEEKDEEKTPVFKHYCLFLDVLIVFSSSHTVSNPQCGREDEIIKEKTPESLAKRTHKRPHHPAERSWKPDIFSGLARTLLREYVNGFQLPRAMFPALGLA